MTARPDGPTQTALTNDRELVESLCQALASAPSRQDLRLRLLRLHFMAGRLKEFLAEAAVYRQQQESVATPSEWHVVAEMGRVLAPDSPLFEAKSDFTVAWDYTDSMAGQAATRIERFGESPHARAAAEKLARDYEQVRSDPKFLAELDIAMTRQARPTPFHLLPRLSAKTGGARIFLKREDMALADTRLSIHVVGQALLARRLGKTTLVTGSIDGRVGVAVASIATQQGLQARVYMDSEQHQRQVVNVQRLGLMGAQVEVVDRRQLEGKDIRESALNYWLEHQADSFMVCGLIAGPSPYPLIAEDLSAIIGRECRRQLQAQARCQPDLLVARGGDNADAIGFFGPFVQDKSVGLVCVDPEGRGQPAESVMGQYNPTVQFNAQQQQRARAILEGMEHASVRREHQALRATGRVEYVQGMLEDGIAMMAVMGKLEGMTPAPDTAQVLSVAFERARRMKPEQAIVVMYAERLDKTQLEISALTRK